MAEGTQGPGTEGQSIPEPKEQITPQQLAELIKQVPNPEIDSFNLMTTDPAESRRNAEEYVRNLHKEEGVVIAIDSSIRITDPCGDCGEHIPRGSLSLVRVKNPDDIEFKGMEMGFLRPVIKGVEDYPGPGGILIREDPSGSVTGINIPNAALHQMETHGRFAQVDPARVLTVLKRNQESSPQVPSQ